MPTYEYECTACGQHIEVFQRIAEDPLTTCGVCGGVLRKVFHPAGIVFKGSGFYSTDSRSKSASSSGSSKGSDGGSSSTKSDGASPGGSSEGSSSSEGTSSRKDAGGAKGAGPKEATPS